MTKYRKTIDSVKQVSKFATLLLKNTTHVRVKPDNMKRPPQVNKV